MTLPDSLLSSVSRWLEQFGHQPLDPGLYLVGTPIGNLGDISLRALAVLSMADRVYCEDTRHSRRLLTAFGLHPALSSYHEHNADQAGQSIMEALQAGQTIALISDAGMPLISDPGFKLVRSLQEKKLPLTVIPGPTAAISALCVSGQPTDSFTYLGFLPAKQQARLTFIEEQILPSPHTMICYESPHRILASLEAFASLSPDRPLTIARELTKKFEQVWQGKAQAAANEWQDVKARGEFVIVIGPAQNAEQGMVTFDDDALRALLREEMQRTSLKEAIATVAKQTKIPRKRVYQLGLSLKTDGE